MKHYKIILLIFLFIQKPGFTQQMQYEQIKKLIKSTKNNADSLFFLNKQLLEEIIKLKKPDDELIECYGSLSEFSIRLGNLPDAAAYASEATLIAEKKGITAKLSRAYYQKARVLSVQNKDKEAMTYFRKSLATVTKEAGKKTIGRILGQIGFTYANIGELDSALQYQNQALKICIDLKDTLAIASCYSNIGYVYALSKRLDLTRDYYYRASAMRKNSNDVFLKAASLIDCASLEQEMGNEKRCIMVMHQALSFLRNAKLFSLESAAYQSISYAYENLNKWDSAYKYHKLFKTASDSLFNQESMMASLKIETKYQLGSKQNEIALLTEKNKNNELLVMREKMIKWVFVSGIGLLVIILFMVFRQLRIKKEAFSKINEQKEIIEEKNKEIIDSIHYAKRIQTALMSSEKTIAGNIKRLKKQE